MKPTGIMPFVRSSRGFLSIVIALIALTLVPRLIGIDKFATIDEPYWLTAGSDFYYALGQRDFANTVYDYHPAVTTMWIVATAMLVYFPEYRGLGQGYFDVYKDSLDQFLLSHDRTPLGLLAAARVLQVLLIVGMLIVLFLLLRRLLDETTAAAGVLLVSFDPFFLGHSRLLNHEGMMALFSLISVLALGVYLLHDRQWILLAISAAAAGLAQLTKSSSIVIVPVVISMLLLAAYRRPVGSGKPWRTFSQDLGLWLATLAGVYLLLWPGMWVAPGRMLQEVFGNAFSYALEGSRLSALSAEPSAEFQPRLADTVQYVQSILWRTTPIVWLGLILFVASLFRADARKRIILLMILLTGVLFVLLFGVASGRNSAHYVLTAYVVLDVLAAAGFADAATRWPTRFLKSGRGVLVALIVGIAVVLQAGSALRFFPYYYTYYNPIMEALERGPQNSNFGYGEGLDLAASYLNQKPAAANSTVTAFYGRGPFSFFYRGNTEPLKTVYADAENVPQLHQVLHRSEYLVIYYALQRGRNSPANVLRALEDSQPEKTIWLNGIEYARIYAMDRMPEDFYERLWP